VPVCEICSHEIPPECDTSVQTRSLLVAIRAGYDPFAGDRAGRLNEQLRENFAVFLEMHDLEWTVCSSCRDQIEAYAAKDVQGGLRSPEVMLIFGNGFVPEPRQWRILLGAWVDRWMEKRIDMSIVGTSIGVKQHAKASFEAFLRIVPEASEQYPGQLIDDLILCDDERRDDMVLLAIWSLTDSPPMRKILQRP